MLIIFDLDDTLVDTSGCITPVRLERALAAMVQVGLSVPEDAGKKLQQINQQELSSRDALSKFLAICGGSDEIKELAYREGVRVMYEEDDIDMPLKPVDGAVEVLKELSMEHQLALVSWGRAAQQMAKLEKAGIDSAIFSKISVSEDKNKKNIYQQVQAELKYPADQVWVCGDRIAIDLKPATELGFRTIHLRFGRGLNSVGFADYTVDSLKTIKAIINDNK